MNNFILEKLEKVSNLSKSISDDANTAKRALSELLTDKDRDDIYEEYLINVLMIALGNIEDSADLIGNVTEGARREFEKEDHNTTK